MNAELLETRLSQISTQWSLIVQAHQKPSGAATEAQNALMLRYGGAAYRYLFKTLKDPELADELFQQFAIRFVRGDFRRVQPSRGRFRQYVKTVLINLVIDYRKQKHRNVERLQELAFEPACRDDDTEEVAFVESWREEVLAKTWAALHEWEARKNQPYFQVLRFKSDHPDRSTDDLAWHINATLRPQRPWTTSATRKLVQRAREKFSELLVREVSESLGSPSLEELEEELIELGLMPHCRSAFRKRRGG